LSSPAEPSRAERSPGKKHKEKKDKKRHQGSGRDALEGPSLLSKNRTVAIKSMRIRAGGEGRQGGRPVKNG